MFFHVTVDGVFLAQHPPAQWQWRWHCLCVVIFSYSVDLCCCPAMLVFLLSFGLGRRWTLLFGEDQPLQVRVCVGLAGPMTHTT